MGLGRVLLRSMMMAMAVDGDGENRDCAGFVSPLFPFSCARALAGVQSCVFTPM
jgi:hypothetical protein